MKYKPIRQVIAAELHRRQWSVYRLWKECRKDAPTITQTAIAEFIAGKRTANSDYCDAMLKALELRIVAC